jgi:hypothetical protein
LKTLAGIVNSQVTSLFAGIVICKEVSKFVAINVRSVFFAESSTLPKTGKLGLWETKRFAIAKLL